MSENFTAAWSSFSRELDARSQKLRKEIEGSWNILDAILRKHADQFTSGDWKSLPESTLASVRDLIHTKGDDLLFDPLAALRKSRSLERAISAIGNYTNDVENLLRLLPSDIAISRHDLAESLSLKPRRTDRYIPGFGTKPERFFARTAARAILRRHLNDRIKWDTRMILLLARASLALLIPWELFRNESLRTARNTKESFNDILQDRDKWLKEISGFKPKAERTLAAYDFLDKRLSRCLARKLLYSRRNISAKYLAGITGRWQRFFSHWYARQRATVAELELEFTAGKLMETAVDISSEALASVDEENTHILAELDGVRNWLTGWSSEKTMDPFPPPEARLMSAEERADAWKKRIIAAARTALPVHVELVDVGRILPDIRSSKRSLKPESCFRESLADVGRGIALAGFREAEEGHRAVIREIERAREVVSYSMEGDNEDTESDSEIAREGVQNAVSLLDYQKETAGDFRPIVERSLVEALAATFYQFHLSIDESKLGLYRYLVRQKGSMVFRAGALSAYERIKATLRLLWDKSITGRDRALIALGWAPPATTSIEPVIRREYLGELLQLKVGPRELPALYKRLFRLTPVEDPRFLVGRDAEIGAMAQARRQWEEGRPVSVLIAGARGSGKTSLLNCAHMAVFNDLPVTTGQFGRRIVTAKDLHAFMAALFQVEVDELRPSLASGKRLVILEEVERTFLRKIGGFEALRALLNLISATSKNTLWLLSLNQTALKFLGNVVSFDESFSHRINAMAVAPEELTNAVLLRHNLSGLRLQLAPPKTNGSHLNAVRRMLGLFKDPEQSYFESLYRQSDGIFRSAFELWLQSVDRVEGGVLYMLSPAQPEYEGMLEQLTLEDAFRLQAILQHGSLEAEEMAQIFDEPVEKSLSSMEKLISWDILDEDPNCPGLRIRPAAGRFVRNALYRQNLI